MGLALLIAGLALFLGMHTVTALRDTRAGLVARLGEGGYKIVYSLVSVAGVLIAAYGFSLYRAGGWIDIWYPPAWTRHLTVLLVWPSIIMIAAAYSPGRIKAALKHPMLAGVKLWAAAHLISNGDLGSIVLFGSVLAWAVFDRISLKRRTDGGAPVIVQGGLRNDAIAFAAGTIAYLLLGWLFHPYVIGVRAF